MLTDIFTSPGASLLILVIQGLNVRISSLDRQEDRPRLLPGPHCAAGAQLNGGAR